jgi:hypothetical protein
VGTRCDFYVGRGPDAEWLGSLGMDGYPSGLVADPAMGPVLAAATEAEYRARVARVLAAVSHATTPDLGWPWPWENSRLTDFAYAFDAGAVHVSNFGRPWHRPGEESPPLPAGDDNKDPCTDERRVAFPDMTARRNVTLGPRSGLLAFRLPKEEGE